MTFFIDTSDKRNQILKTLLEKENLDTQIFDVKQVQQGDICIFSPAKKLTHDEANLLTNHTTIFCGNVDDETKSIFKDKQIKYINMLKNEVFTIKNANLTTEGVLGLIIEHSEKSIYENNILILGSGRIAKSCAILFSKLGVNYDFCYYRDAGFDDFAFYKPSLYFKNDFKRIAQNYDIIINTIPEQILFQEELNAISSKTLFIETASKNCLDSSAATHFTYLLAPALPQKFCSQSAAKLVFELIMEEINAN